MVICYTKGVVRKGKDMPNAIQQLLEKFLAVTNEEQAIFFNAMVASRSGERINDMGEVTFTRVASPMSKFAFLRQ